MGLMFLALFMVFQQGERMVVRRYGRKHDFGGMLFNAVICLFAMLFFVFSDSDGFCFPKELWVYGILSCVMFATGFYSIFVAYNHGSYVLSNMISSFSGVITILYGILFLKEPAGFTTYSGIILVFVSVSLMQYKKGEGGKKAFSFVWLISVVLCAASNGLIGIIQKEQQMRFSGAYDNEFMIISFGGAFLSLVIFALIKEKEYFRFCLKPAIGYGILAGTINGAVNLVSLLLLKIMNISVLTPFKTGLGFLFSFVVSVVLYKESFTKLQLVSAFIGVVALVLFAL